MAEERRGVRGAGAAAGELEEGGSDVELSLRLRTRGSSAAEEEAAAAAARRRSMTIFYDGRVCAVDVTELQARTILSIARQEMLGQHSRDDDLHRSGVGTGHQDPVVLLLSADPRRHASPASPHEVLSEQAVPPPPPLLANHTTRGLSMKRSLQRFLQKRKTRAMAVGMQAQQMRF